MTFARNKYKSLDLVGERLLRKGGIKGFMRNPLNFLILKKKSSGQVISFGHSNCKLLRALLWYITLCAARAYFGSYYLNAFCSTSHNMYSVSDGQ